jgi:hypothetical protein
MPSALFPLREKHMKGEEVMTMGGVVQLIFALGGAAFFAGVLLVM